MSNKLENPPAFPVVENGQKFGNYHGMTLRDYFAAKAMQAMVASDNWVNSAQHYNKTTGEYLSQQSYELADAMLKARQS